MYASNLNFTQYNKPLQASCWETSKAILESSLRKSMSVVVWKDHCSPYSSMSLPVHLEMVRLLRDQSPEVRTKAAEAMSLLHEY